MGTSTDVPSHSVGSPIIVIRRLGSDLHVSFLHHKGLESLVLVGHPWPWWVFWVDERIFTMPRLFLSTSWDEEGRRWEIGELSRKATDLDVPSVNRSSKPSTSSVPYHPLPRLTRLTVYWLYFLSVFQRPGWIKCPIVNLSLLYYVHFRETFNVSRYVYMRPYKCKIDRQFF